MQGKQYQELYLESYRIITTQFEHITQYLPIIMQLKNGESDCWPITCPPIFCTHPVFLPGSCCPACVKTTPGDCLQRNHSLALQKKSCLHNGHQYKDGDNWPVVANSDEISSSQRDNGCTSCKCKVKRIILQVFKISLNMTMNL